MSDADSDNEAAESRQIALAELQRFEAIRRRIREIERRALAKLPSRER